MNYDSPTGGESGRSRVRWLDRQTYSRAKESKIQMHALTEDLEEK